VAICPFAQQRGWKPYDPERVITPTTIIVHTNAVDSEDPGSTGGLTWHFQVGEHGDIYQHRDTETRAAANASANSFAISIETWDGGDPEGNPWSPQQLDALYRLIDWCCTTHHIPRVQPGTWDSAGIGYHRMFGEWNNPVHSCPGDTRAAQFHDVLLPRLQSPSPSPSPIPSPLEDDMAVLLRTPSDGKIWCVSGAGRWHVKDAAQELPLVEWNVIHGTTVTDLTDEQEAGFALIPEIPTP